MRKLLCAFFCFALLLTVVACADAPKNTRDRYDGVIARYTELLTAKKNGEELSPPVADGMDEQEVAIANALYGIVDYCEDAEALGYAFRDMDGNGTEELLILTQTAIVQAVFTLSEGAPLLLEANYGQRNIFVLAKGNRFFMRRTTETESIEEVTFYTSRVDGEKMVYDAVYGNVYDTEREESLEIFQIVDGIRTQIDKEAFYELYREFSQIIDEGLNDGTQKWIAPRIYLPLKAKDAGEDLPVADFSDYAAIRETYSAIATALDKFDVLRWIWGEYDNLFAFPNDLAFEYYNRLLFAAYRSSYRTGYDEIDLNGDGQDELVLLDEDYRIKAIFTMKNGIPALLDAFARETCWLDADGFIHVDREDYYELEYSLYEFQKSGAYDLVYSVLAAKNGKRYLTKNGKTERISFEESLEIYHDDYCRYAIPFSPKEETRNTSDLTYTPLTPPSEDLLASAKDKTWHKYVNLTATTDKDMAYSNTYVTFDVLTDTEIGVHFKYAYTFLYQDPDGDRVLLEDTTESFLNITAAKENDTLTFDDFGVKGKIEFGEKYLWLIIEESTDDRFAVGYHCYEVKS